MIFPDAIRKCVVFIGYRLSDGSTRLAGTGFLVARPADTSVSPEIGSTYLSFAYLLTAKHIIDFVKEKALSEVLVRLNYRDGKARWISTRLEDWQYHPTEANSVDVALLRAQGLQTALIDHGVFPIAAFATPNRVISEQISIGEETVIVGLFAPHSGSAKNIPVLRIGNIAAMPEEKVSTTLGLIDAYLIEARSSGGLSGSPVFVNLGVMRDRLGVVEVEKFIGARKDTGGTIYLLGLIHGHFDDKNQNVNMGIGIVVPAAKILEVINQESILVAEKEISERHSSPSGPTMDVLDDDVGFTGPEN